jgi:alkylation response protein AidB-like acyl-CoA dehydrogenase
MEWDDSAPLRAFREQARTWLEENVPTDTRPADPVQSRAYDSAWMRAMYDGGWAGVDWEPEYGGLGLSLVEQVIWNEELVRAGAPGFGCFSVAFAHAGPTLILRGSEEQKEFYLPRILSGETPWCQGFSEPSAGSDLAAIRTRGVVDGDELVVTGQKVWTSYGDQADFCELLVRTDPDAERHRGLTWVAMDMRLPGVDVRPIPQINGSAEFCEVFYDAVRVPLSAVVEKVNHGWSVAMATLAAERGPGFLDRRLTQISDVDDLIEIAQSKGLMTDDGFADRVADLRAATAAVRSMAYYQVSATEKGKTPGFEASTIRAYFVQLEQLVSTFALDVLGQDALATNSWTTRWTSTFAAPIAGGTKDILKNVVGERVLGLPR